MRIWTDADGCHYQIGLRQLLNQRSAKCWLINLDKSRAVREYRDYTVGIDMHGETGQHALTETMIPDPCRCGSFRVRSKVRVSLRLSIIRPIPSPWHM